METDAPDSLHGPPRVPTIFPAWLNSRILALSGGRRGENACSNTDGTRYVHWHNAIDMKRMHMLHGLVMLLAVGQSCVHAQSPLPQTYQAAKFEDPQQYAVAPGQYPAFRMPQLFQPPENLLSERRLALNAVPPISADDLWQVRFKVREALLIYSDSYQERYCELLSRVPTSGYRFRGGRCTVEPFLMHVWINASGQVTGGWFSMKNTRLILLGDDGKEKFFLNPEDAKGWMNFEPVR